ncbi:MAG TPA: NAD(P)H-hydrate dehydratase, partial [Armatimonadota bacterium]|nr:NAD(P)H-hydrate dehydratase [Armatimonadota bacterium]
LELIDRCDAVAIGPGIGKNPETIAFIHELLPQIDKPMVIDADGLNAIAEDTTVLSRLKSPAILTPHPGEMSRLTGTPVEAIQSNRLKAAQDAAERFGVTMVLKGASTVIASPSGEAWINSTGSVALASGGTGDILTGAIVGLLAQGLEPLDAAICGVYLHGRAGELTEDKIGDAGVSATDLLPLLPRALAEVGADNE